ncbi:MAG: ABC transporter permease [Christensenellales bacterium]|nr:ABC transporter permease [Christensenellaceae bacterium]
MTKYVMKRLIIGLIAVVLSVAINFVLIRVAPGDPITIMAGMDNPNQEMIDHLISKYGLDKPILTQFGIYLSNIARGDFGYSYRNNQPVMGLIGQRLFPTFLMTFSAAILALVIGSALGLAAARTRDSRMDRFFSSISYIFDAMPGFWLALMLILLFASRLKWFPTMGMINMRAGYTGWAHVLDVLYHLALPVICLVLLNVPRYFRITRAAVLQVMSEDYITLFRASGMNEKQIFRKFVLKNALLPTVTIFGLSLAGCFMGASLIEIVFAWPGMGRLLLDAITKRDYSVLSGVYFIFSMMLVSATILVDVVCAALDPRIRLE